MVATSIRFNVDAVVFTHGSHGSGRVGAETVDYGGVRNVLTALAGRQVRIVLMTAIGITNRASAYNRSTQSNDWKRRAERLVRASGHPYTIVRPGWFDYGAPDQRRIVLLQGDRRNTGTPNDGAITRIQIVEVLVRSLTCEAARRKTFELVAETGSAPTPDDLDALFAALVADPADALDGVGDAANLPLSEEPASVRDEREALLALRG